MVIALDANNEIFIVYIAFLIKPAIMLIYYYCKTRIPLLTSTKIHIKYFNFFSIFLLHSIVELLEYTKINSYLNNLLNKKQLSYNLIYNS